MNTNLIIIDTYRQKYKACALLKSLGYTEINANGGTYPCLLIINKDKKTVSEKPVARFEEPKGNYSLKDLRNEANVNKAKSRQFIKNGMNLIETPQSIVPGQSEIDSWPQLKRAAHPCQDKCSNFKDEECCHCLVHHPIIETKEIIFDAEKWLYERKSAYPMVDCVPMPSEGLWRTFGYHPVCHGITLQNNDVITLDAKGNYTVKPKDSPVLQNADEAKHYAKYLEAVRYAP